MAQYLESKTLYLFSAVLLVSLLLLTGFVCSNSLVARTRVDPSVEVDYLNMEERKVIIYSLKNTGDKELRYFVVIRLGDLPPEKKEIVVEGRSSYRGRFDVYPEVRRVDIVNFTVFEGDEEKPVYDAEYHVV